MEGNIFKKLKEVEGKEKYHDEVSNRFAAHVDLNAVAENNSAWGIIRENITISVKLSVKA
jgi:hypothetical protein